jgi:hypothetical protein
MGILLNIAKRLHTDFHGSGASTLERQKALELLELVAELAAQVEHLSHDKHAEERSVAVVSEQAPRS